MWKNVVAGIILDNIETVSHFQTRQGSRRDTLENILQFVIDVITNLPWYFHMPVRIFATFIGLICMITTGSKLNMLSSEKRSSFMRLVKRIPSYVMVNKLIRSMDIFHDGYAVDTNKGCVSSGRI